MTSLTQSSKRISISLPQENDEKRVLLLALSIIRKALVGIVERPDMPSPIAPKQRIKLQSRGVAMSISTREIKVTEETYLMTRTEELAKARSHRKRERLTRELSATRKSSGVELAKNGQTIRRASTSARKMKRAKTPTRKWQFVLLSTELRAQILSRLFSCPIWIEHSL